MSTVKQAITPTHEDWSIHKRKDHVGPYFNVNIPSLDVNGKTTHHTKIFRYGRGYAGIEHIRSQVREYRDSLLKRPDVKRYIKAKYGSENPTTKARTEFGDQDSYSCPGLVGVFLHKQKSGRSKRSYGFVATVPTGKAGEEDRLYRASGKRGIEEALMLVLEWRCKELNVELPNKRTINKAVKHVTQLIAEDMAK